GNFPAFRSLLGKVVLLTSLGTLVVTGLCLVLGERMIAVIYTSQYAEFNNVLVMLVLAAGIQSVGTLISFGMTATRNLASQAWIQGATLIAGVITYWGFTTRFGLEGAGFATMLVATLRSGLYFV